MSAAAVTMLTGSPNERHAPASGSFSQDENLKHSEDFMVHNAQVS
jgi:hypothetical protein